MDKESDLCPDVQPFVPKLHRRDGMEAVGGASSPMLPNTYAPDWRRNQGFLSPRRRPATADGDAGPGGGRDKPFKNGFGSNRGNRGTTDGSRQPNRSRAKWDPQTKTSKRITDPGSKERIIGKKSPDGLKRGPRSAPNSAGRPRAPPADQAAFQVKMADFPELAMKSPAAPVQTRVCWGPPSQEPASANKTSPVEKPALVKPQPQQHPDGLEPESSPNLSGQAVVAPTQTEAPASVAASWANIASQPPKKPAPKQNTVTSTQQEEGPSDKKKRKKKRKKPNGPGEETAEPEVPPEPPKFEDKGEFPDLGRAFFGAAKLTSSSNTAKLCKEGIQREGVVSQSDAEVPAGKPPSTQITKKGQKAEKVSGKKSKAPVQLDIGTMLEVLEKKQQSQKAKQDAKPVILSVGGALPVNLKQPSVQKKLPWQQDKVAHNPLDSTSPMVKKGKQREVPKAKKPTPLKRVILKEREERKQNRLLEERGLIPGQEAKPAAEEQSEISLTGSASPPAPRTEEHSEEDETNETSLTEPEGDGEREEGLEEEEEEEEEEESESVELQPPPAVLQPAPNRPKIHSRKFRDYCSQVLSKDVDECVSTLLRELVRFQDRLYQKDPMRARMKRRLVMGLREVLKHLRLRKVKCVVISPNCERIQSKGGLDEALHTIIDTCREQGVPFVFALSRKALGRCVSKAVPVSLVGIFNYDGAQDFYHKMIELSSEARRAYEVMMENLELGEQTEVAAEESEEREGEEGTPSKQPPGPDAAPPDEPEYIKLWKKMLEKDCNHKFFNLEEHLGSLRLDSERTEQSGGDKQS